MLLISVTRISRRYLCKDYKDQIEDIGIQVIGVKVIWGRDSTQKKYKVSEISLLMLDLHKGIVKYVKIFF